jgi:hypothetical protein
MQNKKNHVAWLGERCIILTFDFTATTSTPETQFREDVAYGARK